MKIDLDKYIRKNRSQLDQVEDLDVDLMWEDFNSRRKPVRKLTWLYYAASAAAVGIILIGLGIVFSQPTNLTQDELVHQRLTQADPNLAAEQVSMIQLISNQGKLINQMGISEKQFPHLFEELKILDSLQLETINDLDNLGDRKNLLRTLLRYYERKARILDLMLYEYEKQENETAYESAKQI